VLEDMTTGLAVEVQGWDPSFDEYDVRDQITKTGTGPDLALEPYVLENFRARQRGLPELPPEMIAVTYLFNDIQQYVRAKLPADLRPEHARIAETAVARAAEESSLVSCMDFTWTAADYEELEGYPNANPVQLTPTAADRVRQAWVDAWIAQLGVALLAMGRLPRTPSVAIALLIAWLVQTRIFPVDTCCQEPIGCMWRTGHEPPPASPAASLMVTTQTAPHGPDQGDFAIPDSLVRGAALNI
jgi:hypothetical protein